MEPDIDQDELDTLQATRDKIYTEWVDPLREAANEPLTFEQHGYAGPERRVTERRREDIDYEGNNRLGYDDRRVRVEAYSGEPYWTVKTGILWLPPFASLDWVPVEKRQVKPKHACPDCGAKHTIKYH